jgi:hypothetical protein
VPGGTYRGAAGTKLAKQGTGLFCKKNQKIFAIEWCHAGLSSTPRAKVFVSFF